MIDNDLMSRGGSNEDESEGGKGETGDNGLLGSLPFACVAILGVGGALLGDEKE